MTSYVTSRDGTRIAYDHLGDGPPVVIVGGIFCTRATTRDLAERLADRFTAVNFDRRGRGESGNTPPYAVEREVEDIDALIAAAGGKAAVYGHSSGAGLALQAAAHGLPVTRLVLHEPPYGGDDDESVRSACELAENVRAALAEDRRGDAIALFFSGAGMPPEMVDAMSADPDMLAVAPTMLHDLEVMGDFQGGTVPTDLARAIDVPTLVLAGDASPDFFLDTAARIAKLLPDATHTVMPGQDHGAPADVVAPVVADFLAPTSSPAG
jgi:pimeloyl-ACP methyl ester carboxylesterase